MKDVDEMFERIVDPWWEANRTAEAPDFQSLRAGIAPYSDLCRHAAWNDLGRYFIRGKGGGPQKEGLGLQCLVEALWADRTNNSAAWTAFAGAVRPELAALQSRLMGLPRREEPGDKQANTPLIESLKRIYGEPGAHPEA